ncbi:MAG: HAD family hydrolase [Nitrospinales bacterium]
MINGRIEQNPREGLTSSKVRRFLSLPFRPCGLKTWFAVKRFEDIPVDTLLREGIEGILLDADGTLGAHATRCFPDSAVRHVQLMREKGLKVAIYTNASENRFEQFNGVGIVSSVPAKPGHLGFEIAMKRHLALDDPAKVCMIGDNYLTDGGAVNAGMRFIYVKPVKGGETGPHRFARYLAYLCARLYSGKKFYYLSS